MAFKIINRSKINKSHLKFNSNFKSHITFGMTLESLKTLLLTLTCTSKSNKSMNKDPQKSQHAKKWLCDHDELLRIVCFLFVKSLLVSKV
jgi:hypothetical protein